MNVWSSPISTMGCIQSEQTRACSDSAKRISDQSDACNRAQVELTKLQTVLQGYTADLNRKFQQADSNNGNPDDLTITISSEAFCEIQQAYKYGFCGSTNKTFNLSQLTQLNAEIEASVQKLNFVLQDCAALLQNANQLYQQWLQWIQKVSRSQYEIQLQLMRKI